LRVRFIQVGSAVFLGKGFDQRAGCRIMVGGTVTLSAASAGKNHRCNPSTRRELLEAWRLTACPTAVAATDIHVHVCIDECQILEHRMFSSARI